MADLRPEQFSNDVANRLRRSQIRGTIEQMGVMLPSNTFFAPALSIQAWNRGINELVIAWTLAMLTFSWWLFFVWRRSYQTDGSARDLQKFVNETFVNSSLWAVGIALFYPVVEGDPKIILTTIMAGTLALGTVGFARAPAAAFAYLLILTAANSSIALLSGLNSGAKTDYIIAFLSLTAGASLFNATLERGKADLAAFKNHEQLSQKSEVVDLLLKDYEQQASEWLWQTDPDGKIISAPLQILNLIAADQEKHTQNSFTEMLVSKVNSESEDDGKRLVAAFENRQEFHDIQLSISDPADHRKRWIIVKGRPQFEGEEFIGFRGIFADATATINAKRQVHYLASHDSLTGLFNRNSAQEELDRHLPDGHFSTAFLIDLDGFKLVNDSHGHLIGDALLTIVADRLRNLQTKDTLVARLGGDEFLILAPFASSSDMSEARNFAGSILAELSKPYQIESFTLQLSASVGIAGFPSDTQDRRELLSMADLALYEAKNSGRNKYEFFRAEFQRALNDRLIITKKLKSALRDCQIRPHYQAQHSLSDGRIIGFEGLARWKDADLGDVRPDIFIPIAEQTGLIVELGEHMLRQCCMDALKLAINSDHEPPVVSVNFSPVQFASIDVPALVSRVLKETGLPPYLLEIEVTEGVLISDKKRVATTLSEISALGVSIALDDFGTGYSSLSYLKDLPLDRIKIDRSFVMDIHPNSANPIVKTVVELGKSLNLSVIAEGVETHEQVRILKELGCNDAQGFLFGKPAPFETVCEFQNPPPIPRKLRAPH